jgi:sugar phosphate isomerase/epimerase
MDRPIALSTMYLQRYSDRHDLPGFAALARELGFTGVELGHVVEAPALVTLTPGDASVPSVHHPCPAAAGGPSGASLAAEDTHARRKAEAGIRRSMDTAVRYGARAVVVHLGTADGDEGVATERLAFEAMSRFRAGQQGTVRYQRVLSDLKDARRRLDTAQVPRALGCLLRLAEDADRRGLTLAIETGFRPHDLPGPDGMRYVLEALATPRVQAWLDTGHVGAQANLGLEAFEVWRRVVAGRWAGAHLHDVVGLRDHLVPGSGNVDFASAIEALPNDAVLTCEIDWYHDADEVRSGREHIARMCALRA